LTGALLVQKANHNTIQIVIDVDSCSLKGHFVQTRKVQNINQNGLCLDWNNGSIPVTKGSP
jgi:hypothetical protein